MNEFRYDIKLGIRNVVDPNTRSFRYVPKFFGLSFNDLSQHLYVLGGSGTGKTTLMKNVAVQLIEADQGFAVLDPFGTWLELLNMIPPRRFAHDTVVYFDPADIKHPVSLNLLDGVAKDDRPLVASMLVSAFEYAFPNGWGPQSNYLLLNCLRALLDAGAGGRHPVSLVGVSRMLSDQPYRDRIVRAVEDHEVVQFWTQEFAGKDERQRSAMIAPLQNKIGAFVTNPFLRNILGQARNRIDLERVMDEGWIFIANLSQGRMGPQETKLIGSLLAIAFYLTAMKREGRRQFTLIGEEFHRFGPAVFADILSGSRNFGLSLVIAHQYLDQLEHDVRSAVLATANVLCFRVSADDGARLEKTMAPFSAEQMTNLPNFEVYGQLLEHVLVAEEPFRGVSLTPIQVGYGMGPRIWKQSRMRFARPRAAVEADFARWMQPREKMKPRRGRRK